MYVLGGGFVKESRSRGERQFGNKREIDDICGLWMVLCGYLDASLERWDLGVLTMGRRSISWDLWEGGWTGMFEDA